MEHYYCALDSKFLSSLSLTLLCLCHTLLYPNFVVSAVSAPAIIANTSRDQETLLYFKSQLSDPLGALASWSRESPDLCKWHGISCSRRHPFRVTALDLDSLSLSGPLSSCIANLTFLERIHLPNNRLHGNIPRDIGRLFRLQYLNLSMNSLDGEIPETLSFCSRLRVIILGDNGLNGTIPYSLSKCLKLQTLRLNNNMLEGEIPPGFGSHPNLQTLVLTSNNLAGNIPSLLGSSSSLSLVRLENNKLGGKIPSFLGNSSSLSVLLLSNNSLTGQIPQTLFNSSTLMKIDLSFNPLTGPIPPFSKISSSPLSYLALRANNLSGGIPPSLGNLSSLVFLHLAENKLEGSIPESLGRIPLLQLLYLSENNLTGSIPSSIYNISSLTDLGLGGNNLSGAIPLDIGRTLPNLEKFNMYKNQLQGQIPSSLSNISGLRYVDLSFNSLDGVVPPNLGSLQNLLSLDFRRNLLRAGDWSFLSSLTNCSLLETLGLQENDLEGTLPNSIGNLSPQLEMLLIGGNRLYGTIPDEIGNLVSLTVLSLDANQFTGIIPATLGNLKNLVLLQLSCNNLSGPIPSIGNLKQLNHLYMQDNELNGSIPVSLGSCKNLLNLDLSYNRLDGIIPKELVSMSSLCIALDLSHNHLYGPIPLEVGSLINLGRLDMSENRLSGEIPSTLGGCQLLEYLHMEGNFLQGNIPQSFQNLKGIKELDLSRNNLSGPIPEFLESFGSLCYLNLSFNDLEGQVPKGGIFSNISEISVLGNSKLCGGDSKLRLPPCSARPTNSRLLSSRMLKVVIILVASVAAISLLCLFIFLHRSRKAGKANQSVHYLEDKYKKVTYADIFRATDRFSPANMVGSGSFGSVYKGKLDAEQYNIAVKVFNLHQHGALKSFTDECEALRNIRHRNLINVITSCSTMDPLGNEFKALIFEYMPNGNLENWLHPTVSSNNQTRMLNLIQRLNIAVDVASALSYLHNHCASPIVHCDLKPSNVLLDNEMIARVTDFGLARFRPAAESTTSRNSTSLIGLKGSIGYIAPEYGMGAKISKEGDVYSYGVLLLEMLTGKRPTNEMFKDGLSLHKFVSMAFPERVEDILDHELFKDEGEHGLNSGMENHANTFVFERCIIPLVEIGLSCSVESPKDRPTMEDVASEILAIKEAFSAARV